MGHKEDEKDIPNRNYIVIFVAEKVMLMEREYKVLSKDASGEFVAMTNNDIVTFEHLGSIVEMPKTIKSEAYAIILCTAGRFTCRIDDDLIELESNDLFLSRPNQFIDKAMSSIDFRCCGMILSPKYLDNILILGSDTLESKRILEHNPVLNLSEDEAAKMKLSIMFLKDRLTPPFGQHHKEMMELMMQSMLYVFYDSIVSKLQLKKIEFTSAESLFSRFVRLAVLHTPVEREVKFYADKLSVTPKYLSSVCKRIVGKTASSILNDMVAKHLKRALRSADKSIKEIAFESGFDNLSFFGKYVKRMLGVSPREFRQRSF